MDGRVAGVTMWSARVEFAGELNADLLDELTDDLVEHSASLGNEAEPDRASVQLSVEAGTLRAAIESALEVVGRALERRGREFTELGIEVLDEETAERRLASPVVPDLVSGPDIAEMAGISKSRANLLTKRADFPPAVVQTRQGPLRLRSQVEAYLAQRNTSPGRRPSRPASPLL